MKGSFIAPLALVFWASSHADAAQTTPDSLGVLIRELVVNSLTGGGTRGDMVFVAADSASAAILRLAAVRLATTPAPKALFCPGSTEANGQRTPPPTGYVVKLVLTTEADTSTRQLDITKTCSFRFRGGGRPFGEGGVWELRREGGRWRVAARRDLWITENAPRHVLPNARAVLAYLRR